MRTASWIWLGYLIVLRLIDSILYASAPQQILGRYFLVNAGVAAIFLGLSCWPWLQRTLSDFYVPLMLVVIGGLPIVAGRLWVPPLPLGPMSNVEGLTLRLLPILFIGLVIAAWQYSWSVIALFAMGTAGLEIALVLVQPPDSTTAINAVIFVALVRSVSFIVVGYFVNYLVGRLQAQQEELTQANARLSDYANTVEQLAVSQERNRLARELHDTLAHTLSGLSVQLETAKAYREVNPETSYDLLEQSLEVTRSGLDETRRALRALRASPLEDLGLRLALKKLAKDAAERGKLKLRLVLPERAPFLSAEVEQVIYRIAQEAIENVVRHAQAQNLSVYLAVLEREILLRVEDDGRGMNPTSIEQMGHYGLKGMHERAQLVGGSLTIGSQPNEGTRVQFILRGQFSDD